MSTLYKHHWNASDYVRTFTCNACIVTVYYYYYYMENKIRAIKLYYYANTVMTINFTSNNT